jgi:hypothetical protein
LELATISLTEFAVVKGVVRVFVREIVLMPFCLLNTLKDKVFCVFSQ